MKSLLLLERVSIENANAISGLTYGFPGITHFLGFTHGLSRQLEQAYGLSLAGCAVIVHQHQLHCQKPALYGERVFALSRNPLTKEGKTAPFNEEGRMHMQVSLLIECEFDVDDLPLASGQTARDANVLLHWLQQQVPCRRLAGGTIIQIGQIRWFELKQSAEDQRRQLRLQMMRLLPGFVLVSRHDLLQQQHQLRLQKDPDAELLDSLLDFVTLRYHCLQHDNGEVNWERAAKPAPGYLVPITVGYQGISPLYQPGEVQNCRDPDYPYRFVEIVYSVGQWLSPHRVESVQQILWHYRQQDDLYLCSNDYQEVETEDPIYSDLLY